MGRFSDKAVPVTKMGGRFAKQAELVPRVRGNGLPMELGQMTGETGRLSDPLEDRGAWLEAQRRDEAASKLRLSGRFGEGMDAMVEGITMEADRPLAGIISALRGEGYDRGKAVDAYQDDLRDERLGAAGTAAGLAGSVLSPSPASKQKLLVEALQGGVQAGIEGQNLATEGDQRNIGDVAKDVAIGSGVTGALGSLARVIKPGELIDASKTQEGLNRAIQEAVSGQKIDRVETAGLALREALLKEQGALKKSGKDAMRKAVAGDFAVLDDARSFTSDLDRVYGSVRDAPIPITSAGTPAAAALKDQIALEAGKGDTMTLEQIDALRVKSRGLKTIAANATDKAALADLTTALDRMVDEKVATGKFQGDPAFRQAYMDGRAKYESAMKIADLPKLRRILKDETVPGAAIADSLLSINTSAKSASPAKMAAVIAEELGEGSESIAAVRQGVLATMFEGASTEPASQAKLLKTLERNETLIGELFTPDQVSELASIRADLTNAASAKDGNAARSAVEKRIFSLLTNAVGFAGEAMRNPGKAGAVTAVASGSGAAGLTVGGALAALNFASQRPVRSLVGGTLEAGSKTGGRQAAQSETIDSVVPNPRDAIIDQLRR
jgi:hypothetical protein